MVKILKFFDADADPCSGNLFDPRSGMKKIRIRDKHNGSATLPFSRLNKELNSAADAVYKLKQNPTKSRDIARLLHFFISRAELLRPPPAFYFTLHLPRLLSPVNLPSQVPYPF